MAFSDLPKQAQRDIQALLLQDHFVEAKQLYQHYHQQFSILNTDKKSSAHSQSTTTI